MDIILIILLNLLLFCIVGLIHCRFDILKFQISLERNQAVYHFRMCVLNESLEKYNRLPSYQEMHESKLPIEESNFIN